MKKTLLVTIGAVTGLLVVMVGVAAFDARTRRDLLSRIAPWLDKPEFQGQVMDPTWRAEGFALLDQRGSRFSMQQAQGKVVVLTFLYTSCTDVCPFIGAKLREVSEELGPQMDDVELIVISTDPERDTRQRRAGFSRSLGMYDRWHFLSGSEQELKPVWEAYFVGPQQSQAHAEEVSEGTLREYGLLNGLSDQSVVAAMETIQDYGGGYEVSHSAPVWLIDRERTVRVMHGQDLLPAELAHDIRILLDERN